MIDAIITLCTIFLVNILLSGDNALVIALASRALPAKHKKMATLLGSFGAVGLRIILTVVAVYLLEIPYLKVIGGVLLLWIAIKLISGENEENEIEAKNHLWGAVKTIIIADAVMSLDNVVAIAGVAKGNMPLIILGLITSVPIIIWGSNFVSLLMNKFPITIILGAGVLGWTAGEMMISDQRIEPLFHQYFSVSWVIPAVCAVTVIFIGLIISRRKQVSSHEFQAR